MLHGRIHGQPADRRSLDAVCTYKASRGTPIHVSCEKKAEVRPIARHHVITADDHVPEQLNAFYAQTPAPVPAGDATPAPAVLLGLAVLQGLGEEGPDGREGSLVSEGIVGDSGHRARDGVLVGEAVHRPRT